MNQKTIGRLRRFSEPRGFGRPAQLLNRRFGRSRCAAATGRSARGSATGGGSTAFIKKVDDRDVSTIDTAFELLPGCHLVETAPSLLVATGITMFTAQLGKRFFPFRMKAGFEYEVVVQVPDTSVSVMRVSVFGTERDPNGARTQEVPAATSIADVQACREWTLPPPF